MNRTAICVAAEVQRDYRNFRLERGVVTYADQIALADEFLQHPDAARVFANSILIIILDEAQDTDPAQFSVLLEMTRPPEATGRWIETQIDPPRPGHFCMVGDFQQSIYHDRADLAHYRARARSSRRRCNGEAVTFSVTFRLDQAQLDFVNATFRDILHETGGQVDFVELQPRPEFFPARSFAFRSPPNFCRPGKIERPSDRAHRGEQLAGWMKKTGPEKFCGRRGATSRFFVRAKTGCVPWRPAAPLNCLFDSIRARPESRRPATHG